MKVLFLDAYNLIHRAKSGFRDGEFSVVFNFFRGIRPIVEKFNPDKVYFVIEGNPKHRVILLKDYKGNRPEQTKSFLRQKGIIIDTVRDHFPFTVAVHPDFECDDVIAELVKHHASVGHSCTIVSSDTDFIQLYDIFGKNVEIYNPIKKSIVERPGYDYLTWKSLRGDKSDNISGIPGIGDKRAAALVSNSKKLRDLLRDDIKYSIFERNMELIEFKPIDGGVSSISMSRDTANWFAIKSLFELLGFKTIVSDKTWKKYTNTFNCLK